MEFSNVIGFVVMVGIGLFIYHKVKTKKDGKGFVERYSGGRYGAIPRKQEK